MVIFHLNRTGKFIEYRIKAKCQDREIVRHIEGLCKDRGICERPVRSGHGLTDITSLTGIAVGKNDLTVTTQRPPV